MTEQWPADAFGRPPVHPFRTGVYLWHGSDGWHLQVNEPGRDRAVITGRVSTDGKIAAAGRHLENGVEGTRDVRNKVVGYRVVNYGGVDGMDFVTRCASRITVCGRHPGSVLFEIVRVSA